MATTTKLANDIIKLVGGKENINSATNCMTRLRLNLKDFSKVDVERLKNTSGVLGITGTDQLQVVVGPGTARKVADLFLEEHGIPSAANSNDDWKKTKEDIKSSQEKEPIKAGLEIIAGIFIPLIPAIIAAGIFNGLASLISTLQDNGNLPVSNTWNFVQLIFALIGAGFLAYFAIYTGINAAKRFGATEALGGMIGAISIGSQINDISNIFGFYNAEVPLESILTTGKGGIIGVIVGVYLLAKIERWVRIRVPDVLDLIVTPLITLLLTALAMVIVIMPVSGFVSDGLY